MAEKEYVYGFHPVQALLAQAPERILSLYLQQGRQDQRVQRILALAKEQGIAIQNLSNHKFEQLLPAVVEHAQGIVALCRPLPVKSEGDIPALLQGISQPPLLLILDGIQDPHNLGACLRSANAAGVHAVIAPKDKSAPLSAVARKVASGAAEFTPYIPVTNLARTLRELKDLGVWIYGLAEEATENLYETDLKGATAFVMGAEGTGLRRLTRDVCDGLLRIPMLGTVPSLNVSVAASVCLFEALRQRQRFDKKSS